SLTKIKPKKIVYISCNPATLARDLKSLTKDYEIKEIQPFDMFPHTRHVETVVSMSRISG
ncbi:MAG: 23S rRNA (uracil(1939)-C(5))-methyltransferase RlmD, partial [Ruminiclostridium sp.]